MQTLIEQLSQQLQQFEQQVQQQIQQMRTTINALLSNSNTTTTATTPATVTESPHSYNNDWLKQMFQPLYDIKLKPLDLILTSAREQYYSDLQNERILYKRFTRENHNILIICVRWWFIIHSTKYTRTTNPITRMEKVF